MTNAVWCLKDCGVWCKCSQGRGEVNYLGLNSYFVLLLGFAEQTAEESDASRTRYRSRSLWKNNLFTYLSIIFSLSKPPQDTAPPGHAGASERGGAYSASSVIMEKIALYYCNSRVKSASFTNNTFNI